MQMNINKYISIFFISLFILPLFVQAQVNTVEFGKNRIQHKKFKWKFYQSENFNTYISQGGNELGKFVAQVAEEELPELETFIEYSLQRRANIIIYTNFEDYKQSNIGLGIDWQQAGGLTKLVNNKLVVFFDGNHSHLRLQIREGIAKVLTDNLLFGDDIGEFASNQALLDLPKWLTDGYIAYAAENWNTQKDDELKSAMLVSEYKNFYHFAYAKPTLAGQAFWNYVAEKYKKDNVTYFLYLARIYKNLNNASLKICKKKFKEVLEDFMAYKQDKYFEDIRKRKNAIKGKLTISEDVSKNDYYNFQVNPNPKNNAYAMVEYKKGQYSVLLNDNYYDIRTLLTKGVKVMQGDQSPNYPVMAWDGKGTRLLVMYAEDAKIKMFVWDHVAKYKRFKQIIEGVDQIVDASFMLDANTVILSAVKNGHTDIFIYKIEENKLEQVTNDVYDDLNPTYVSFPNRSGIIFSSNRPSGNAISADTVLPSHNRFNIFLVDILNKSAVKQITQLSNLKYGNATYPMQYNVNHFTFVADENGIGNRYAGFFSTQRNGLDTLYYVGEELLRNPTPVELDSTLSAWRKQEPDSVSYFQVYLDSTFTFPITNYQSSLLETRIAGNNGLVSEVRKEGDYKFLYKLKVDDNALNRRNVNPALTNYMKTFRMQDKQVKGKANTYKKGANQCKRFYQRAT
jgi:Tol biopolymer transport system component